MCTAEETQALLTAAHSAFVEKAGKQPHFEPSVDLYSFGAWFANLYGRDSRDRIEGRGDTPAEAIDALIAAINALPSEEEANLREFQQDLGHLIDKGREFGIDVAYINPLTETAKRLSENALTHAAE